MPTEVWWARSHIIQATTPSTPDVGFYKVYMKPDFIVYKLTSDGVETPIGIWGWGAFDCWDVEQCIMTDTSVQQALQYFLDNIAALPGWGTVSCTDIADCISISPGVQTALQNFIESTTFTSLNATTGNFTTVNATDVAATNIATENFEVTTSSTFSWTVVNNNVTTTNDWGVTNNINSYTENRDSTTVQNNDGWTVNNTDTIINNTNVTENNTGGNTTNTNVTEYYDQTSTIVNEWDAIYTNLTVININYAEPFVAGVNITDRQPLRMWVSILWEDTSKVYVASADDILRSNFIGFAGRDALLGEELPVLQGPRVGWLKAVYGALVDMSSYYLSDTGTISLVPGTINVRLGDADGDDALVWLNTPINLPPVQTGYTVTWGVHAPAYNSYNVITTAAPVIINLPTAVWHDGEWIKIKKASGEDVAEYTIVPTWGELIDWLFTSATMNINRTMYTLTAVAGGWYLGD